MTAPRLGVAYYPEQWPRERWRVDAELMAEAGLSLVRVGEFAWARLEPDAGRFEFDWLDEAIGILAAAGLEVVLGTPTAAPPAWLVERHPEILPVGAEGRVFGFGHRRHYCPNRPAFRRAVRRVVAALAERYGGDERVVAWQIDNELGGRCYCDACTRAFRAWLRVRYATLDALNEAWGTAFWSQTYGAWRQIPLPPGAPVPLPRGFLRGSPNPGLALDYRRFVSDGYVRLCRLQAAVLRERCARPPRVTTNLMGFWFPELDYHTLAGEVDFVAWDNYPILHGDSWTSAALAADAMRGLKDAPVWVAEQQVGPLGWELVRSPRRGQLRLLTHQAVAHGAEAVLYFRWRSARFGTEQHWHGVLPADGRPGRRYRELATLARELEPLAGAVPQAEVALLHDYDSRFADQVQPTNPALHFESTIERHYAALRRLGLGVDVVSPARALDGYALVVAPSLQVLDPALAAALAGYVEAGGALVLGPRSGVKDRCNAVPERPLPAWLDELAGLEVTDFASAGEHEAVRFEGGRFHGWYEELELKTARPLALYEDGEFAGAAAVAEREAGRGRVVYVAGVADEATLRRLYATLAADLRLPLLDLPDDVEAVPLRRDGGEPFVLLLNHADAERTVGPVRLRPFDVAVLEGEAVAAS